MFIKHIVSPSVSYFYWEQAQLYVIINLTPPLPPTQGFTLVAKYQQIFLSHTDPHSGKQMTSALGDSVSHKLVVTAAYIRPMLKKFRYRPI